MRSVTDKKHIKWEKIISSDDGEQLLQFMRDPYSITPPEGESYADFKHRILTTWDKLPPQG